MTLLFPSPCYANPFIFAAPVEYYLMSGMYVALILCEAAFYNKTAGFGYLRTLVYTAYANFITTVITFILLFAYFQLLRDYAKDMIYENLYYTLAKIAGSPDSASHEGRVMMLYGIVMASVTLSVFFFAYYNIEKYFLLKKYKCEEIETQNKIKMNCFLFNLTIFILIFLIMVYAFYNAFLYR